MLGRRGFLGVAAGLFAWTPGDASSQTPGKADTNAKAKAKTPTKSAKPADASDGAPVEADEGLGRVLSPICESHRVPGMVGAIVRGSRLAAIAAVGKRKLGSDEAFRVTDRVHIGSCTKAMTATLLGMFVDEGKLSWSSTVAEVFPDLAGGLHADFRPVTLSQLLTHRAGLPETTLFLRLDRGLSVKGQRRKFVTEALKQAPVSRPGTEYAYTNNGYIIAGAMAEELTGRSWEDLTQERLFRPLGMATAGFGSPGSAGKVDEPWGHHNEGGEVKPNRVDNPPLIGPAGTVHCSMADWAKFATLHLRGGQGKGQLVKPGTFRTLHTPPPGREYAGGWFVVERSWAGGKALNHKGSNKSWFATIWLAPARDLAVLVATNQGDGGNGLNGPADLSCDEAIDALLRYDATLRPASARRKARGRG
jgi:CubicO group peptidase (beta-lactamase class C family)